MEKATLLFIGCLFLIWTPVILHLIFKKLDK